MGGGNLGHVVAGIFASRQVDRISVLTRKPENWHSCIEVFNSECKTITFGRLFRISSNPKDVISDADIVLICLPGYAIHCELEIIKPFLKRGAKVGSIVSSSGFFFEAHKILPHETSLFGFQRVPYISRIIEYGRIAEMKGKKSSLSMVVEHIKDKEDFKKEVENLFQIPVKLLDNYYEVSFSNSNPLLHSARLYTLWKDWHKGMVYDSIPQLYTDWTDEASFLYIQMDNELQSLLSLLSVKNIPSVLEYYESHGVHSLTNKISHIPAFIGIPAPMLKVETGYIPDFSSRYFVEDFSYGMHFIVEEAEKHKVLVPTIQRVYNWGIPLLN